MNANSLAAIMLIVRFFVAIWALDSISILVRIIIDSAVVLYVPEAAAGGQADTYAFS